MIRENRLLLWTYLLMKRYRFFDDHTIGAPAVVDCSGHHSGEVPRHKGVALITWLTGEQAD